MLNRPTLLLLTFALGAACSAQQTGRGEADPRDNSATPISSADQKMDKRNRVPKAFTTQIIAANAASRRRAERLVEVYEILAEEPTLERLSPYIAPDYVQHSPMLPDGPAGVASFFATAVAKYPVEIDVHKVMVVGDYGWAHVNFRNLDTDDPEDLGAAAVDIYAFGPDDRVIEHWDAVQGVPAFSVNPHGMFLRVHDHPLRHTFQASGAAAPSAEASQVAPPKGETPLSSAEQKMDRRNSLLTDVSPRIIAIDEKGRERARRLIELYAQLEVEPTSERLSPYVSAEYVQHSPMLPDGPFGVASFFASAVAQYPVKIEVHRVMVLGDWAMAHVNFRNLNSDDPTNLGAAGVDLYTFGADEKLTEHWDAVQGVPAFSVNPHGMFKRVRTERLSPPAN